MLKSKKKALDTASGRTWYTISDLDDLVTAGVQMDNALSYKPYAERYSSEMNLFFLMEKEDVVLVNASYYKNNLKRERAFGPKNVLPDPIYKSDLDELDLYLEKKGL